MSNQEPSFLREYNNYKFYDAGTVEGGDPGDSKLLITYKDEAVSAHSIFFNLANPANVNKAIEKAKEWVDDQLGQGNDSGAAAVRYSDDQLNEFKGILDKKVDAATKELEYLQEQIAKNGESTEENAAVEQDQLKQMADRQTLYIKHLTEALTRIENKTYGICRVTGKLIDADRLRAVPHATLSTEAKKAMDQQKTDTPPAPVKEKKSRKTKKEKQEAPVRKCRVCGCTENDCSQCIAKTGSPCHWVEQDLCSACVEAPEIKVSDERASANVIEDPIQYEPTGFFKQLALAGEVDLTLRMKGKNDKITVELIPAGKSLLKPILVTGTPDELDEGFFPAIVSKFNEISGLKHNLDDVKKEVQEKAEKKASQKPPVKSKRGPKTGKKKATPKPTGKKRGPKPGSKRVSKNKPGPKPKKKPGKSGDLFTQEEGKPEPPVISEPVTEEINS